LHQRPFRPFALSLENGDRIIIEHPENIAFDPTPDGSSDFYAFSQQLRVYSTFDAVISVSLLDVGGEAGAEAGVA
jgi:hypothetical protein